VVGRCPKEEVRQEVGEEKGNRTHNDFLKTSNCRHSFIPSSRADNRAFSSSELLIDLPESGTSLGDLVSRGRSSDGSVGAKEVIVWRFGLEADAMVER
jgi:hypothetical protein